MKRLILHIGVEKTGTTSLQQSLCRSARVLEKLDVYYPKSLRQHSDDSHKLLTAAFIPFKRRSFIHPRNRDVDRAGLLAQLAAELSKTRARTIVISSEHLHSRFYDGAECNALVQSLKQIGLEDITVVAYLRRQDQLIQAAYREAVRWGSSAQPEQVIANIKARRGLFPFGNYSKLLGRWADAVGAAHVVPRIYDRGLLVGGSTETDFLSWLRPDADLSALVRPEANKSWSAEVTQYIARANDDLASKLPQAASQARGKLAKALESLPGVGGKNIFTPSERSLIREVFRESNASVASTYFPDSGGELFGATTPDSQEPAKRVDDTRFEEIRAALNAT